MTLDLIARSKFILLVEFRSKICQFEHPIFGSSLRLRSFSVAYFAFHLHLKLTQNVTFSL